VECFESVCLVCVNQTIWLTTGGVFPSSCLRLFHLNIDGKHTLQEHMIRVSGSHVRGHISTLCSIADVGIAGAFYQCQFNRSTLFHIPLDIFSSNIPTEVCEVGIYPGKVSSVLEVTGTQHWIVGLSKDDVVFGNLKLGQIVKCISWPTPFPEAPECLKASTEG
ncbi:uncharacterized protein LOC117104082, partial [Anneissia japonica]|uniref:uncharacterized protein LOC117104082 n=1 Tax=Anneissia japonica TaxID=1529436 RepID=UPI001425A520